MNDLFWNGSTLLLAIALAYLSWTDLKFHRLPDRVTLPLIVIGLVLAATEGASQLIPSAIGGTIGFGLFALIGQIYFQRHGREGLGLGDAKLFAAAGTWLGWPALPATLLIAAGGALAFALIARRDAEYLPFGPWIAVGFFLMWLEPWLTLRP